MRTRETAHMPSCFAYSHVFLRNKEISARDMRKNLDLYLFLPFPRLFASTHAHTPAASLETCCQTTMHAASCPPVRALQGAEKVD